MNTARPLTRVITTESEIYEGGIFQWGRDESPKDVLLVRVCKVTINANGVMTRSVLIGQEMYFPESSIKEIIFDTAVMSG
jgi:hypothetical protein